MLYSSSVFIISARFVVFRQQFGHVGRIHSHCLMHAVWNVCEQGHVAVSDARSSDTSGSRHMVQRWSSIEDWSARTRFGDAISSSLSLEENDAHPPLRLVACVSNDFVAERQIHSARRWRDSLRDMIVVRWLLKFVQRWVWIFGEFT